MVTAALTKEMKALKERIRDSNQGRDPASQNGREDEMEEAPGREGDSSAKKSESVIKIEIVESEARVEPEALPQQIVNEIKLPEVQLRIPSPQKVPKPEPVKKPSAVKNMDDEFQEVTFKDLFEPDERPVNPPAEDSANPQGQPQPKIHNELEESESDGEAQSQDSPQEQENQTKEKGKMLKKRKPKKKKQTITEKRKLAKERYEIVKENKERAERAECSVKFARHTTTNIRFDPSRLGIKFLESKNQIQNFAERRLSNADLGAIQAKFKEAISITDMVTEFMEEINFDKYAKPVAEKLTKAIVPTKTDIEATLKCLKLAFDGVRNIQGLSEQEMSLATIGINCWQVFYKFLNSLDSGKLFSLKGELVASSSGNRKEEGQTKIERLSYDLRRIIYLLVHLQNEMDYVYKKQSLQCFGDLLMTIISKEIHNNRYLRMFSDFYSDLVDRLNLLDDCKEVLESVNFEIFKKAALSKAKKYALEERQPDPFVIRLDRFLTKSYFKVTSKYWGNLVQSVARYYELNHKGIIDKLCENTDNLLKWIHGATDVEGTTLERAFFLGGIKLAFTTTIVEIVASNQASKRLDNFLSRLESNQKQLPIYIAFYQALSQRVPNLADQKALGLECLNKFIIRYLYKSEEELYLERKIKVPLASRLEEVTSNLLLMVEGKNPDSFVKEAIRMFTHPAKIDVSGDVKKKLNEMRTESFDQCYSINTRFETLPQPFETYLFWIVMINEIYLTYSSASRPNFVGGVLDVLRKNKPDIDEKLKEENRVFLSELVNNFPSYPILSLRPNMSEHDCKVRILIVHLMVQFMLMTHNNEFLSLSTKGTKNLYLRDQVCAYPGEEEEKLRIIAQMVYDREVLKSNSFDSNTLNKCPKCNYYYFIGNCGKPYQISTCPECKSQIGGEGHNYVGTTSHKVSNEEFLIEYSKLEKLAAKRYKIRDPDNLDTSISMRFVRGALNFQTIELFVHARYMLEFIVGNKTCKDGLRKLIGLPDAQLPQYLLKMVEADLKPAAFLMKSEFKAFLWMNVLTWNLQLSPEALSFNKAKRNYFELELSKKIGYFEYYAVPLLFKLAKVNASQREANMQRLISNWISETATVKDFTEVLDELDLRIISGLRNNVIEIDKNLDLREHLQKVLVEKDPESKSNALLRFVISHELLLRQFPEVLDAHLSLSNYLMQRLDGQLGWKDACALSIADLIRPNLGFMFIAEDNQLEKVLDKFSGDEKLKSLYENFVAKYKQLMTLRDVYPDLLDLRFMCHTQDRKTTADLASEITDPLRAKVAYFLVSETKPESMAIMSILQTLSQVQSKILDAHLPLSVKVNGNKPLRVPLQQSKLDNYLRLNLNLEDLLTKSILINKHSKQVEFDLNLLDKTLAEDIFLGIPYIDFDSSTSSIVNYNLFLNFPAISGLLTGIGQKVEYGPLGWEYREYVDRMTGRVEKAVETLQNIHKELAKLPKNPSADTKIKVSEDIGIPLSQIKDLYEILELKLYNLAVKYLDPSYLLSCPVPALITIPIQLVQCVQRIILRIFMHNDNQYISNSDLRGVIDDSGIMEDLQATQGIQIDIKRFIPETVTAGMAHSLLSYWLH